MTYNLNNYSVMMKFQQQLVYIKRLNDMICDARKEKDVETPFSPISDTLKIKIVEQKRRLFRLRAHYDNIMVDIASTNARA